MHLEINAAYKLHLNILKKIQPMNKTPAIQQFNNLAIQQFNHLTIQQSNPPPLLIHHLRIPHFPRLVIPDTSLNLLFCIHHKRSVGIDRLIQRLSSRNEYFCAIYCEEVDAVVAAFV